MACSQYNWLLPDLPILTTQFSSTNASISSLQAFDLIFFVRAVAEDDKEAFLLLVRESDDPRSFFFGFGGVFDVEGLRVVEDFAGFTERDTMLFEVVFCFVFVPLIAGHNPWLPFHEFRS
ncbi:MAG: hypothetical protein NTV34_01445 [Proteobacteria bacterium]|nr:hypothetical protein [Pseudomonadota bacterium]